MIGQFLAIFMTYNSVVESVVALSNDKLVAEIEQVSTLSLNTCKIAANII